MHVVSTTGERTPILFLHQGAIKYPKTLSVLERPAWHVLNAWNALDIRDTFDVCSFRNSILKI